MSLNASMETFVYEGDQATLSTRWKEWVRRFENFLIACAITTAVRQKALLLHFGGKKVIEIFDKLDTTPIPADAATNRPAENEYDTALRVLNAHFNPKINVTYNRHVFKSKKQADGETVDQFHTRLSALANGCQFHDKDEEIKSQIILLCKSRKLRAEALNNPTWNLTTLLEKATTFELTKIRAQEIEDGAASNITVNKIGVKKGQSNNKGQRGQWRKQKSNKSDQDKEKKSCNFCGGSWHNKLTECPARKEGVVCKVCKKQGHFARACLHPDAGKSTKSKTPVRKVKA